MSEKRFRLIANCAILEKGQPISQERACYLLNEICEENRQLKKEKAQLTERLRECRMRLDRFNCR